MLMFDPNVNIAPASEYGVRVGGNRHLSFEQVNDSDDDVTLNFDLVWHYLQADRECYLLKDGVTSKHNTSRLLWFDHFSTERREFKISYITNEIAMLAIPAAH